MREKILIAVLDKGYSRYPNEEYPLNSVSSPEMSLLGFVSREFSELREAIGALQLSENERLFTTLSRVDAAKMEVGDTVQTLQYLFDGLDLLERALKAGQSPEECFEYAFGVGWRSKPSPSPR